MANANRSNDGDEDSLLLLLSLLSALPNRSLHCAAAATMLSSPKHTPFHPLVYVCGTKRVEKRKRAAPRGSVWGGKGGKGFYILVTSTSNTNNLLFSTPLRPSSNRAFVPSKSRLAVATIGREVFCKRRRVSAKPIPREAGVVRIHPPPGRGAILFLGVGLGGAVVCYCVFCVKGTEVERRGSR